MGDWEKYGTCPKCHRTMHDEVICACGYDRRNVVLDSIGDDLKRVATQIQLGAAKLEREEDMIPNCPVCGLALPARWANDVRTIHEDCARPASPAPYQILLWATNTKVETLDKLTAPALKKLLRRTMDWVSEHMVINTRRCFICPIEPAAGFYNCLPVCKRCLERVSRLPDIKTDDVQKTIDAVYARHGTPPVRHIDVCSNRRLRHSYKIKTPAGYLQYDGGLTPDEPKADLWTKAEVMIESAKFQDLGTPLHITRVIK